MFEMMESDYREANEKSMDKLELSSDFIDSTVKKKRPRMEDCMDEAKCLSDKKWHSYFSEQTEILKENNAEAISDKNSIDEYTIKKEKHIIYSENSQNIYETSLCKSNMDMIKEKQLDKSKQENKNKSSLNMDKDSLEININDKDKKCEFEPLKELLEDTSAIYISGNKKIEKDTVANKKDNIIEEQDNKKNGIKKKHIIKSETTDTEVVDGLELSVECASDKEEPSSENEDKKDTKPRSRTIIIKAEPNESELECSSSEEEKYNLQEAADIPANKSEKKKTKKKTQTSKVKGFGFEDSQNNNSDEDYCPQIKRKMKKSPEMRSTKHLIDSRTGQSGNTKKNFHKKSTKYASDDNADTTLTERVDKLEKKKMKEELSEKELSIDKSESNNSEDEERSTKGKRTRRSNAKEKDNKQIQRLKKYLSIAGIRIKYNTLSDCKNNSTRIRYLKELLEKNGVNGRPTLEKCKRAKEENERIREISELDMSNIISEGRITRARRNMDNGRKVASLNTSSRHREARNTFKRIQTVIDSDSE